MGSTWLLNAAGQEWPQRDHVARGGRAAGTQTQRTLGGRADEVGPLTD